MEANWISYKNVITGIVVWLKLIHAFTFIYLCAFFKISKCTQVLSDTCIYVSIFFIRFSPLPFMSVLLIKFIVFSRHDVVHACCAIPVDKVFSFLIFFFRKNIFLSFLQRTNDKVYECHWKYSNGLFSIFILAGTYICHPSTKIWALIRPLKKVRSWFISFFLCNCVTESFFFLHFAIENFSIKSAKEIV